MLLFLDTEFTDAINCDLISIAMVSNCGRYEFYAERTDFERTWCNPFTQVAVLPQLGQFPAALAARSYLCLRLRNWFGCIKEPVVMAYDSATDWELLVDALDGEMPPIVHGTFDLKLVQGLLTFGQAMTQAHDAQRPWHHALFDVRAQREGWLALRAAGEAPALG